MKEVPLATVLSVIDQNNRDHENFMDKVRERFQREQPYIYGLLVSITEGTTLDCGEIELPLFGTDMAAIAYYIIREHLEIQELNK